MIPQLPSERLPAWLAPAGPSPHKRLGDWIAPTIRGPRKRNAICKLLVAGTRPAGALTVTQKTRKPPMSVSFFQLQDSEYARARKPVIKQTSKHPRTQRNENS